MKFQVYLMYNLENIENQISIVAILLLLVHFFKVYSSLMTLEISFLHLKILYISKKSTQLIFHIFIGQPDILKNIEN